ncbi:Structural maintenance of chromosomes flexible hinge domain-containing protein 1 [Lamellibrachia satsuma]|nr:Structural maintenance of chromosomes flexible hinge domain-containing protein 1 [Lamellibrachia satsuma]
MQSVSCISHQRPLTTLPPVSELYLSPETTDDPSTSQQSTSGVTDIKKQSQMAALSKERDNLRAAIKAYRSLFDTTQQLINELRISLNEAMQEETRLKAELRRQGLAAVQLVNVAAVDSLLAEKTREKDRLLHLPRRVCGLHPAQKDRDVLGKVGKQETPQRTSLAMV